MGKRRHIFQNWIGRALLIFLGLVLLGVLVFYLNRERIKDSALTYFNEMQPGELHIEEINLIPFLNFPRVSVKLDDVNYYEQSVTKDSSFHDPILSLKDIYVSLNIIDLIRGEVNVTQARIGDGILYLKRYDDSTTNIENAIGILFSEMRDRPEEDKDTAHININLNKLQISSLEVSMDDRIEESSLNFHIHKVKSSFNYLKDTIGTGLEFDIDLKEFSAYKYKLDKGWNIKFDSDVQYDRKEQKIIINPSMMGISNTTLEIWGEYVLSNPDIGRGESVDLSFRALNTGIELLNFIFRGVLDMDELEQIGDGSIYLSGSVKGGVGSVLPVIRLNCEADDLGFNIKSIQKELSDISFSAYASNGGKADLSEAVIVVKDFSIMYPQGKLEADASFENLVTPDISLDIDAELDLEGMDKMIETEMVRDLKGTLNLNGKINGSLNKTSGEFLDDAGSLVLSVKDLSFLLPEDSIGSIDGEIFLEENQLGIRNMEIEVNEDHFHLSGVLSNLLPYLYGIDQDIDASIGLESDVIHPAKLSSDSVVLSILGEEIKGLHFLAGAHITHQDLDKLRSDRIIPTATINLEKFQVALPSFADISDVTAELHISPDSIELIDFTGKVGKSEFTLNSMATGLDALNRKDSAVDIEVSYHIESALMRAEDFFTANGVFLLPQTYQSEYLEDFLLEGNFSAPISDLLIEDKPVNFSLRIDDLNWGFKNYPLDFTDFFVMAHREDSIMLIDEFRGRVGESDLKMKALLGNFFDSIDNNLYGSLEIKSDLLNFNKILNFHIDSSLSESALSDTLNNIKEAPELHEINYPNFELSVDIGKLIYGNYSIHDMAGMLRSSDKRIFYLDELSIAGSEGGKLLFDGQFNVANPYYYTLSANLDLKDVSISDIDIEFQTEEGTFTLEENFSGIVDAEGIAEVIFTPELKLDMTSTTAIFDLSVRDGALINFTPMLAAEKFLKNVDLDYIRFADMHNKFTLFDSQISIPLMSVASTVGQILIEGEQGLDQEFVYLLRLPMWLVRGSIFDTLSDDMDELDPEKAEIQNMKSGRFMRLTVWGDKNGTDIKLGDKRDKIK